MAILKPKTSAGVRRYLQTQAAKQGVRPASYGVGGSCMPPRSSSTRDPGPYGSACPPTPEVPGCIRPGRTCDVGRIGSTLVVAGGTTFNMQITPRRLPWFKPLGVRCTVTDLNNSDLSHRVLITAVRIGGEPQLTVDDTSPTLPTAAGDSIDGFFSDDWIDPDGYAVPVGWQWCSNAANERQLVIFGATIGLSAATNVLVSVSLYGNAAQSPNG